MGQLIYIFVALILDIKEIRFSSEIVWWNNLLIAARPNLTIKSTGYSKNQRFGSVQFDKFLGCDFNT